MDARYTLEVISLLCQLMSQQCHLFANGSDALLWVDQLKCGVLKVLEGLLVAFDGVVC